MARLGRRRRVTGGSPSPSRLRLPDATPQLSSFVAPCASGTATDSPAHPLTRSPAHPLTHSPTHPPTPSPAHPPPRSPPPPPPPPPTPPLTPSAAVRHTSRMSLTRREALAQLAALAVIP